MCVFNDYSYYDERSRGEIVQKISKGKVQEKQRKERKFHKKTKRKRMKDQNNIFSLIYIFH